MDVLYPVARRVSTHDKENDTGQIYFGDKVDAYCNIGTTRVNLITTKDVAYSLWWRREQGSETY